MPEQMHRLSRLNGAEWVMHRHSDTFAIQAERSPQRLVLAPSERHLDILFSISALLTPPFEALWVLHTPRGGSNPGRYQSPPLSLTALSDLLLPVRDYLERDGRHDFWIHSRGSESLLVWDRHDLIYLYGVISVFEDLLSNYGLHEGEVPIPSPHAHNYHAAYDLAERSLANAIAWRVSPLREADAQ